MKKAIVVGSGAGGATAAKELQGAFDVTVLEAGGEFRPFRMSLPTVRRFKKAGLMSDEREIGLLFPSMNIMKADHEMVLVRGIGTGGTTTIATGNGLRMDELLARFGIDLSKEYDELEREVPVSTDHQKRWHPTTRRLYEVCTSLGLNPRPTPKMGDNRNCTRCGRCVLGCQHGAKWDSRQFLNSAVARGARLVTHCKVSHVVGNGGRATGVMAHHGWRTEFIPADLVVLAAGGFETPKILWESGIECDRRLFVDPVLCLAARWMGSSQDNEISMPFFVQRNGYILSPYLDYLSYFFRKDWREAVGDTLSLMVKIADSNIGTVTPRSVEKVLNAQDRRRMEEGTETCLEIFERIGVKRSDVKLGTVNAGHPGGMLPLTGDEVTTFHSSRLPDNVYVADATLIPTSLGNPPIFTIMAMAKRVCSLCKSN